MVTRVKTGIKELDKLVGGGFVKNNTILLSGYPGTGKTIFGLQYAYNGAAKFKEKSLFISFEQSIEELRETGKMFGLNMKTLEKMGRLFLIKTTTNDFENNISEIISLIKKNHIKRIVIDSISSLIYYLLEAKWEVAPRIGVSYHAPTINELKNRLFSLLTIIKGLGCTTLITSELLEGQQGYSRDQVSEFLSDGVIVLRSINMGDYSFNVLRIPKMRMTNQSKKIHAYEITNKGFTIKTESKKKKTPNKNITI